MVSQNCCVQAWLPWQRRPHSPPPAARVHPVPADGLPPPGVSHCGHLPSPHPQPLAVQPMVLVSAQEDGLVGHPGSQRRGRGGIHTQVMQAFFAGWLFGHYTHYTTYSMSKGAKNKPFEVIVASFQHRKCMIDGPISNGIFCANAEEKIPFAFNRGTQTALVFICRNFSQHVIIRKNMSVVDKELWNRNCKVNSLFLLPI